MTEGKILYIISTDSYHKADLYEQIFDRLCGNRYQIIKKNRAYEDHCGRKDYWTRWIFRAKVSKGQLEDLKWLTRRADLPGFYLEGGY